MGALVITVLMYGDVKPLRPPPCCSETVTQLRPVSVEVE